MHGLIFFDLVAVVLVVGVVWWLFLCWGVSLFFFILRSTVCPVVGAC